MNKAWGRAPSVPRWTPSKGGEVFQGCAFMALAVSRPHRLLAGREDLGVGERAKPKALECTLLKTSPGDCKYQ